MSVTVVGCFIVIQASFWTPTALMIVRNHNRLFEIDYANNQFVKDGEPFRYVSGSLHYFRVPRAYWRDRLRKYRAAGMNTVCTYIEWKLHEPQHGVYNFEGESDFERFVKIAQEENLLVILRPGPYICSERDFGGYPPWLLHKNPTMGLRTSEPSHKYYVWSWLRVLMPRLQPLLYGNGGPVIMLQVENEYGSYSACDLRYTLWLRDVFRSYIGDKAVLFTTDGAEARYLKCGRIPGVFTTVDFGPVPNVTEAFEPLRAVQKEGPLVNSEFYNGHLTNWSSPEMSRVPTDEIVRTLRQLLALNVSFNIYMFHGGTNFGFTSGANTDTFRPQVTSYDFDAPISESGNLTEKYFAIRNVISEYMPVPPVPIAPRFPTNYGTVRLEPKVNLFDSNTGLEYGTFQYPQTLESLQQYGGLLLYQTVLPSWYSGRVYLVANNTHDRAIVFVNKNMVGVLSRLTSTYSLCISGKPGDKLSLLVENMGHINYMNMTDLKGLTEHVTLDGTVLSGWTHTGYPLDHGTHISGLSSLATVQLPAFYSGCFQIPGGYRTPSDTFVDMTGWGKGVLYVNGLNLGRYWSLGPQFSLYLPGTLLHKSGDNTIMVMEMERGVLYVNGFNLGRYWSLGPQFSLYLPGTLLHKSGDNTIMVMEMERVPPDMSVRLVERPVNKT